MLEKLGRGELAIITSDAIQLDPVSEGIEPSATPTVRASLPTSVQTIPQHVHYHAAPATNRLAETPTDEAVDDPIIPPNLPRLVATGICAAVIIGSLLYVADRIITLTGGPSSEETENIITPKTDDLVAGYRVSDEYGIRPFHPVTGEPNVPHNGVDLAMPVGTPIYAVGRVGDEVQVKCWWDDGGGGWVVNQTAQSYPGHTFQSLHMSETGCREGENAAGDAIAYSGNSGLGTGAHYDFRVKIDGTYVPPATKFLESAITGEPPRE